MMNLFELDSVGYFYPQRKKPSLQKVSFSVREGEFILILGSSGSGKSTVARILGGLIPEYYGGHLEGKVFYQGKSIAECKDLRRNVGIVFQNPERQILAQCVENEITLGMENLGFPREEMGRRLNEVLGFLNLESLRHRETFTLSGGEKQRVILGAVLAMGPNTLILDEPTSQLDPKAAEEFLSILRRLHREFGYTVILIEHKIEHCYASAERVLFFDDGRLVVDDTALAFMKNAVGHQIHYVPKMTEEFQEPSRNDRWIDQQRNHAISCQNVSFSYSAKTSFLDRIDLKIHKGFITAIVGENGAGKSTLLKLLAGLIRPFSGKILIEDKPIESFLPSERVRTIGYLPQQPDDFLFNDTVEEELNFTLRSAHISEQGKLEQILNLFDIEPFRYLHPKALSVGERERVALASVWIASPKILLLDEPTRGLGPDRRSFWAAMLRQFVSVPGHTVVFVSQDIEFVAASADHVIVMDRGVVKINSTLQEISCA